MILVQESDITYTHQKNKVVDYFKEKALMKNRKKIVVLGSAGNLGMYFIDYLLNNLDLNKYEIIATGTKAQYPFEFYKGKYIKLDITKKDDFNNLPQNDVYAVVDFAGVLPAYLKNNNPDIYIDVNIKGTLNVLEYCKKANVDRILYMQTWADLNGYLKDKKPLKPYLLRKPIFKGDHSIYVVTKDAAVDLIECYHQNFGLKNFIFRLPNIYLYSPNMFYYVDGEKRYVSYRLMIQMAIEGKDIEMWGNPNLGKDIIYVKDLCQMIYKALFVERKNGIYNAGTGIKTTMREQIEGIIKVFSPKDNPSKIIECPEKRDCDDFVMDIENAKDDLGYIPQYTYIKYLEDYKKEMKLNKFIKNKRGF